MTEYRKVSAFSRIDAAYIAGLIDGEGTITLSRKHKNDNRQLVISISNTEQPLLDYVLATVGAGKITRKKTYKENHTPRNGKYNETLTVERENFVNDFFAIHP